MFVETLSGVGNRLRLTADLFGSPLTSIHGLMRRAMVDHLRKQGHTITLRGRGVSTLYVNRDASGVVIARRNVHKDGSRHYTFHRIGTFTRRELLHLHSLHT